MGNYINHRERRVRRESQEKLAFSAHSAFAVVYILILNQDRQLEFHQGAEAGQHAIISLTQEEATHIYTQMRFPERLKQLIAEGPKPMKYPLD